MRVSLLFLPLRALVSTFSSFPPESTPQSCIDSVPFPILDTVSPATLVQRSSRRPRRCLAKRPVIAFLALHGLSFPRRLPAHNDTPGPQTPLRSHVHSPPPPSAFIPPSAFLALSVESVSRAPSRFFAEQCSGIGRSRCRLVPILYDAGVLSQLGSARLKGKDWVDTAALSTELCREGKEFGKQVLRTASSGRLSQMSGASASCHLSSASVKLILAQAYASDDDDETRTNYRLSNIATPRIRG
ncbi:hypothetical protein FA13DRAFT_1413942 [Coprinellus micaceus]|uniref:Uncharacterized protein n=1 Tax=Coprinellus micaceus TaxID=71717 RepID=A0A4Y7SP93_COPMI|nr:hypothetical protein FA13DRAFT_1413942 [Coprinellus micaceus]